MKKLPILSTIASALTLSFASQAAVYQIVPISTPDNMAEAYALDINESETIIAGLRGVDFNTKYLSRLPSSVFPAWYRNQDASTSVTYDHPIDITQLDFDDPALILILQDNTLLSFLTQDDQYFDQTIDYVGDVKNGNFTLESKILVLHYLHTRDINLPNGFGNKVHHRQLDGRFHQIGEFWSALATENQFTPLAILDQINPNTNQLSLSFNESAKAINDAGWIVGATETPYVDFDFEVDTDENDDDGNAITEIQTFHIQENVERGFVKIGDNLTLLEPVDKTFRNGRSIATDISNSGYVVGYVSTGFQSEHDWHTYQRWDIKDGLSDCDSFLDDKLSPLETCHWRLRESLFDSQPASFETLSKTQALEHRAYRWKLDAEGNIVETLDLGVGFPEQPDKIFTYYSQAVAVNDAGIAVGQTHVIHPDNNNFAFLVGAVFKDGEVITLLDDRDVTWSSQVTDINNNNIAVGKARTRVNFNSNGIDKVFYYNLNDTNAEPVFIDDGLENANSDANAINDQGLIVGVTDVVSLVGSNGRRHGFLYNINDSTFSNLNDLVECDSEYTIVSAEDITESGVILASATKPVQERDIMGEPLFNPDTGEAVITSHSMTVKLIPIEGGEADNCFKEENTVERKGASWPIAFAVGMFGMLAFRRRTRH